MKKPSNIQEQAIRHFRGPAQIIAGPGSGKTFTLISRICCLIQRHLIDPDHILVITYTRAAAAEMKERFERTCQSENISFVGQSVHFGTFHSICYQILNRCGRLSSNSLIKEADKKKLLKILMQNAGLSTRQSPEIILLLEQEIGRQKNLPNRTDEVRWDDRTGLSTEDFLRLYKAYDAYLKEQGLWDFDDMIRGCMELFSANPGILEQYRRQFRFLLVDEFQDINPLQYQLLKLLAAPDHNLFVVGDDDQAIYGFRGATPGIMRAFSDDFPGGKRLMLTENYRSGEKIVAFAGKMISANRERFAKDFVSVRPAGRVSLAVYENRGEEEKALIAALSSMKQEALCQSAVILRTNKEVLLYSQLLTNARIPVRQYKPGKEDIFQCFIMEDILCFLSYLYLGGRRADFLGFMNKPNRFISRQALTSPYVSQEQLERYYCRNQEMRREAARLFKQLSLAKDLAPCMAISLFRKAMGYEQYLYEKAPEPGQYTQYIRWLDRVQTLFQNAKKGVDPRDFISRQEKQQERGIWPVLVDGVHLLTMHGSKGLEFDTVFLPDVNQGVIPPARCSGAALLEEERRLLYVAVTRAREDLIIYYTKERGRKPSVFLQGLIPPHLQ